MNELPAQRVLRAPAARLARWAVTFGAIAAGLIGIGIGSLPNPGAAGFFVLALLPLGLAVRIPSTGIVVTDIDVVIRGITMTRRVPRSNVVGVGIRADSMAARGAVCVGIRTREGMVLAPSSLSTRRGSQEADYWLYQLSEALQVPIDDVN